MKKLSLFLLRISITAGLLIFLFSRMDIKAVIAVFRAVDPLYLSMAFLSFLFLNFLIALRWYVLLKGLSIKVSLSRAGVSYLSSLFINLLLPSTIGGDTARTIDIARHSRSHSSGVLATVVLDRVGGFCGLMIVLGVSLFIGYSALNDPGVLVAALIFLGIVFIICLIAFSTPFFNAIFKFVPFANLKSYFYKLHSSTVSYKGNPRALLIVLFLSVIIQGGLPLIYYWVALSLGAEVQLIYFFIFVPVITVISVIPVTIGGLGVRDTACVALFVKAGMTAENALALSLSNFIFVFILGVFGGLVYVVDLYRRRV